MNATKIKEDFILFLKQREVLFKPVHNGWYVTRCPYCGDTQKNFREGHFYMKISPENNYVIGYNCFRCGEHGVLNEETIDLFDGDQTLRQEISFLNKHGKKVDKTQIISEERLVYLNYKLPPVKVNNKIKYIEDRLGVTLSEKDYSDYKIITSFRDFLVYNDIKTLYINPQKCRDIEDHYVGFLSNGNTHILFRDITEKEEKSWIKYPICNESFMNKCFYSVASVTDVFTNDDIIINLSEGVFDSIGITKHFNQNIDNTMNIAICGKKYQLVINKLISLGLVGKNITINIYSDNDEKYGNKKNCYTTTLPYYKKALSIYKNLFKKINVYYNMKGKDYGVDKGLIILQKRIL